MIWSNFNNENLANKFDDEKLYQLLAKYIQFVIDYFSWNIYTYDCEKNHYSKKEV